MGYGDSSFPVSSAAKSLDYHQPASMSLLSSLLHSLRIPYHPAALRHSSPKLPRRAEIAACDPCSSGHLPLRTHPFVDRCRCDGKVASKGRGSACRKPGCNLLTVWSTQKRLLLTCPTRPRLEGWLFSLPWTSRWPQSLGHSECSSLLHLSKSREDECPRDTCITPAPVHNRHLVAESNMRRSFLAGITANRERHGQDIYSSS